MEILQIGSWPTENTDERQLGCENFFIRKKNPRKFEKNGEIMMCQYVRNFILSKGFWLAKIDSEIRKLQDFTFVIVLMGIK